MEFIDLNVQQEAIREELQRRLANVLHHGQYIMGPEVREIEDVLRDFVGVRHCVTVSSGTDALLISLMALGVGVGDEVVTTPFTFVSTAEVIALLGATPVFVDVERETGLLDAGLLEMRITDKTKAIIPVSLYGQMPDMDEINNVASKFGDIPVIEDAAQSFGATVDGRKSCGVSTLGCTSFFPSKPLGCYGDGGAIFTNDDSIAKRLRQIRIHGQSERYTHARVGVCGRLDTLQAAILLAKWPRFTFEVAQRKAVAKRYRDAIDGTLETVRLLKVRGNRQSVFGQFTVIAEDRDAVRKHLERKGIPTAVHYPSAIGSQPAYKDRYDFEPTPVADWLSRHVLSLPMGPDLTVDDQIRVIKGLFAADSEVAGVGRHRRLVA